MTEQTPRWLNPDERRVWLRLSALMELLPAALDAQLQRDADLTKTAYLTLAMLSEEPTRSLRMSELGARSNASPSRISHVVSRLEKDGWVRREKSPCDGRGQVAILTDAGYDKVVASAPGHVERVRELVFDPLAEGDLGDLDAVMVKLLDVLDPDARFAATALAREVC
ncbi:MarR family winged helix-turn-helix transcriptional regulator [Kineococcus rhizosphaerae]|uniref:DNA-binding MarR family transcriptional regulator n=1 Tax=Kineococcus rhizosphaerae TaxID=559628 RepID=A0A2T0QY15_9ACTN|nr:MarR family transcriptional regulator [Kineococcus rhizosphaerae]PRY11086.1 DNA-binding MarR family transcriptional regulator [Kineococcus rhizosphaerae]